MLNFHLTIKTVDFGLYFRYFPLLARPFPPTHFQGRLGRSVSLLQCLNRTTSRPPRGGTTKGGDEDPMDFSIDPFTTPLEVKMPLIPVGTRPVSRLRD